MFYQLWCFIDWSFNTSQWKRIIWKLLGDLLLRNLLTGRGSINSSELWQANLYANLCNGLGVDPDFQGICMPARLKVFFFPTTMLGRPDQLQLGPWCWRCWTLQTHAMWETSKPAWKAPHQTSTSCFFSMSCVMSMGGWLQMTACPVKSLPVLEDFPVVCRMKAGVVSVGACRPGPKERR